MLSNVNGFLWIGGFPSGASFGEIWPTDVRRVAAVDGRQCGGRS